MDRKLSAILAADVVGYSAQMERDEAGTFERLRTERKELFEPEIARHHGRIFKLMGDGLLADFGSVVDAVECAVQLQRGLAGRNATHSEAERTRVRIGINLGEVIVEGEDRYGDGVNIAARLESLADPGGVLVSGTVFDQVERRLEYGFEFLGERQVKNIARPVRIYRMEISGKPGVTVSAARSKAGRARYWIALAAVAVVLAGAVAFWQFGDPVSPAEVAPAARMLVPLPDKPSIAVLPFTNMSSEPGQENFTDGMTDALITDLSKVSGLFIISRNSTFVYKGKAVKIAQVAEELGVRYVLEGSVQRAGEKVRVNAQLVDTLTGAHIWADRYDGNIVNIFDTQDDFVGKIVEALEVKLTSLEKQEISSGKTKDINAKEAFDEGWSLYLRYNANDTMTAISALQKAVEIDPSYGRAYAALSLAYIRIYDSIWFKEFGMSREQVWDNVTRYLHLAEQHPTSLSHVARAMVDTCIGSAQDARQEAGRAVALDPNDPEAHIAMAFALTVSGEPDGALEFVAAAKRLNPNYPSHYVLAQAIALFASNKLEEAVGVLEEGVERNPEAISLLVPLSSILAQLGRRDEARQVLSKGWPDATDTEIQRLPNAIILPYQWGKEHRGIQDRLVAGFRAATLAPLPSGGNGGQPAINEQ